MQRRTNRTKSPELRTSGRLSPGIRAYFPYTDMLRFIGFPRYRTSRGHLIRMACSNQPTMASIAVNHTGFPLPHANSVPDAPGTSIPLRFAADSPANVRTIQEADNASATRTDTPRRRTHSGRTSHPRYCSDDPVAPAQDRTEP